MDYQKMTANDFRAEYIRKRDYIYGKTRGMGSLRAEKVLEDEFVTLCEEAIGGDAVSADLLAEWFRNGNQVVPENIEVSLKWLVYAGALGNKFSLDRLKLHFNYSFDQIIELENFGEIAYRRNINEYNYQYVLGGLMCKAVIEDMNINAYELAKQKPSYLPFSPVVMRAFDRSVTRACEKLIEELKQI
ncbi:MAG: hypothetical protein E7378_04720 [Clostridiales bacterium]|nr:hypothetical protein [Clostridiales bacterium]